MTAADAVIEVENMRSAAQDVCHKYLYIEKIARLAEESLLLLSDKSLTAL
jgi:hypothetical protein